MQEDTISHPGEIKYVRFSPSVCFPLICSSGDLYAKLRATLLHRLHDKGPTVRTQAVIALSKLAFSEVPSELEEGEPSILDSILDTMAYDTSP